MKSGTVSEKQPGASHGLPKRRGILMNRQQHALDASSARPGEPAPRKATIPLDDQTVATLKLKDGKTDKIWFDDRLIGFGIRLRSDGGRLRRTWIAQYRAKGRTRRLKIGDAEKLNADHARTKALVALGKVADGKDPQSEKEEVRKTAAHTMKSLATDYLAMKDFQVKEGEYRASSYRVTKLYLTDKRYFGPLHTMTLTDISLMDVADRLDVITRKNGRVTSGRARSALSSMFTWAMKRGKMGAHPINPVMASEKPKDSIPRERVLTDQELGAIWHACGDDEFGRITRLLILTGCRRAEIGGLRRDEIDFENGVLTLPATRVKNWHEHKLPLMPMAFEIICNVPKRVGRNHLFGDRSGVGFTDWSRSKADLDKRLGDKVAQWGLHDIRRSVSTGLGDLGIEPHIIEIILNHFKRDISKVYNLSTYGKQVRSALALWNDHVQAIVETGKHKILPFPRTASEMA
jgi:integrase